MMTAQVDAIVAALRNAHASPSQAHAFVTSPISALAHVGVHAGPITDAQAVSHLAHVNPAIHSIMQARASGQIEASSLTIDGCSVCIWLQIIFISGVVGVIAGAGAVSGGTALIAIPEVVALAAALGITPNILVGALAGTSAFFLSGINNQDGFRFICKKIGCCH